MHNRFLQLTNMKARAWEKMQRKAVKQIAEATRLYQPAATTAVLGLRVWDFVWGNRRVWAAAAQRRRFSKLGTPFKLAEVKFFNRDSTGADQDLRFSKLSNQRTEFDGSYKHAAEGVPINNYTVLYLACCTHALRTAIHGIMCITSNI